MSGIDVREIKELMRGLDKADPDGILDILGKLKRGVHPTEKLLRETKLGIAVNKHRNDPDPRISSMVKTIIRLWKEKITAEKNRVNGTSASSKPQQSGPSKSPTPSASASSSGGGGGASQTVNSTGGPRSAKADGVSIQIYNDKVRNSCVEVMYNALCVDSSESPETILNHAKSIEKTVHSKEGGTTPAYRTKMRSLMMNLKDKSNPHLRQNVVSGNISAERLCKMSPQEMASDDLKKEIEQLSKKNLFNAQGAKEIRAVTDRFTCGKCKHKKVSYYQMQTRSADEPLTTFCTCENCGNRWKFS